MSLGVSNLWNNEPLSANTIKSAAMPAENAGFREGEGAVSLENGQQIRGMIVKVDGNQVTLKTADDTTIMAKMDGSIPLKEGMILNFEVRMNANSQIALSPLYANLDMNSSVSKALMQAGLPVNESNTTMVNEMMNLGMGIDKTSLLAMSNQIAQYPIADPATLVQMKQIGLSVTPENISNFEQLKNNTDQVVKGFEEIGKNTLAVFHEFAENGDYEGLGKLAISVARALVLPEEENVADKTADYGTQQTRAEGENGVATKNQQALEGTAKELVENLKEQGRATGIPAQTEQSPMAKEEAVQNPAPSAREQLLQAAFARMNEISQNPGAEALPRENMQEAFAKLWSKLQNSDANNNVAAKDSEVNILQSKDFEVNDPQVNHSEVNNLSANNLTPANSISYSAAELGKELARLLEHPDFEKEFLKEITGKWLLKPEEVADKEQVHKFYEKVLEQSARLMQALEQNGKQNSPMMKSLQNMTQNVEFMNELNQAYALIQLPLKMSGQNAQGDLYVYTNRKHAAAEDGTVTAFLHLDMEHLGDMEVYVALNQDKVSTRFFLEDESVMDFLESHMDELNERLQNKGYDFNALLQTKEQGEEGNVFEQMMKDVKSGQGAPMVLLSKQSFDARA